MTRTLEVIYDGKVLCPTEPIHLEPNTRIRISYEAQSSQEQKKKSFLNTARSLQLEGPEDWSENIEAYLYGSRDEERK